MEARHVEGIEAAVDAAAAAALAASCAFALSTVSTAAAASAALVIAASFLGLRSVPREERVLPIASFEAPPVPLDPLDELLLTDADRLVEPSSDELLLDDVLAELGPDSRVVRLFDPASMPTPGELRARIDRHLTAGGGAAAPADASQALHDALAELRRALN
jgi:hypothetical protein